jgi:hypothetical protein
MQGPRPQPGPLVLTRGFLYAAPASPNCPLGGAGPAIANGR